MDPSAGERGIKTEDRSGFNGAAVPVVEDEFLVAVTVEDALLDRGAAVVGPAHDETSALRAVEAALDGGPLLAGAILDVYLGRGRTTLRVARRLIAAGVPLMLYSGASATGERRFPTCPDRRGPPRPRRGGGAARRRHLGPGMTGEAAEASLLEPGRNCWRVERADRVGLIVDAADYFALLRQTLMAARREVLLIGWDFDFESEMLPGQSDEDGRAPDGLPNALGDFIEAVVARSPELRLYLLK